MDILRSKYKELCSRQSDIEKEVIRGREKLEIHTKEVSDWLNSVDFIKKSVNDIETLLESKTIGCFSTYHLVPKHSKLVIQISKEVDQLIETTPSANELYIFPKIVYNVRDRSQLSDIIWESMTDSRIGINGIYGYGGVGKTTVMRKIHDHLCRSGIFDKIFWVTLSKDLSLRKLQNDIALQMNLDLPLYENVQFRAAQILERLKMTKKFLIIFDNISRRFSLEEVGVPRPKGENGCKIVVITRSFGICKDMNADIIVEVEPLVWEEAWNLFVNKAGNVVYIPDIQPFAKQVVTHCRGLPIGLVSVGHAMRDEVSVEVWKKTFDYVFTPEVYPMKDDYVFKLLRFSYKCLNNDKLQNCFLYCAFFPEDYLFNPEELIRYWMAEKFIYVAGDIVAEIDEGFKILRALQDANMLQTFAEGGEVFLKMHPLHRDLAIRIMKPALCVKAGLGLMELPFNPEWARARKMSLMRNALQLLYVSPTCPQLSTLLLNNNPISDIISPFFHKMLALKFLDLSYSLIIELPTSLSELTQLRVLFLHYCTHLKHIPCLEKLKKLRSLCLCGTSITELPQGMEGLVSLRSLDLSETTKLESIQVGLISSLVHLEELRLQGSRLCKMAPMVANYLIETRSLKRLAILTLSVVGYGDHLDTIVYLQGQNLKIFSVNVYGSTEDYIEDVETM
ncbi:hypothetical protein AQUCO_06300026v1 [Aquilegia coerulea]|uniref:Uncharacterized protein n=1 Tax=Aquilegia coerulea TaxID=218851 RepID=A0A2G5CCR5_AQUCA|nr:hypothetical protein AQUCO_06300026v1 [Aquilegia coerulea]